MFARDNSTNSNLRRRFAGFARAGTIALATVFILASCDGSRLLSPSPQTIRDLNAAQALWTAQGISRYEFTLQRGCFCADLLPMHVTVTNGVVVDVRRENSLGESLPESDWASWPSIERLFAITAEAIARPAAQVNAEYDSVRGFPHTIYIDQAANIADDEFGYTVTNVRVR